MIRILFIWILLVLQSVMAFAGTERAQEGAGSNKKVTNLSYWEALVLGAVQGLTEFLPISSTGHLIIASRALKLDSEDAVLTKDGTAVIKREGGEDRAYTMNDAVDSYAIVIQGGTMLAIIFLYWKRIGSILMGLIGRDPRGMRLARNIVLAFLPAAGLGLLLGGWIEEHLFGPRTVVMALIGGAILMFVVEGWRRAKGEGKEVEEEGLDLDELTVKQALGIGGLQCIAMWPGVSRSMITIVGGYMAGLSPARAAEFSFLLGLVTLSAASCYEIVFDGANMVKVLNLGPAIFGCGVAFVTGVIAVKWLIRYLTKHGLSLFAWYRIALAAGILLVNYMI